MTSSTIDPKIAREFSQQELELTAVDLLDVGLEVGIFGVTGLRKPSFQGNAQGSTVVIKSLIKSEKNCLQDAN
jgi:hypothetical protein